MVGIGYSLIQSSSGHICVNFLGLCTLFQLPSSLQSIIITLRVHIFKEDVNHLGINVANVSWEILQFILLKWLTSNSRLSHQHNKPYGNCLIWGFPFQGWGMSSTSCLTAFILCAELCESGLDFKQCLERIYRKLIMLQKYSVKTK